MQRKPIANKYRKGTMKSTLQARMFLHFVYRVHIHMQAPKGVKQRVKSPNSTFNKKHKRFLHANSESFFFFFKTEKQVSNICVNLLY